MSLKSLIATGTKLIYAENARWRPSLVSMNPASPLPVISPPAGASASLVKSAGALEAELITSRAVAADQRERAESDLADVLAEGNAAAVPDRQGRVEAGLLQREVRNALHRNGRLAHPARSQSSACRFKAPLIAP